MKPKILLYDIEVSRDIVAGYGPTYEFKVVKTIQHQQLMCFAYKWLGDKKVSYVSRHDFPTYKKFVQFLAYLQNEADIVIAHNANRFDNKMANRFFLKEGIPPPSPYKSIDTLQVARSKFKFQSNSLRALSDFLELGEKEKITYADLEDDFMTDKPSRKTLRLMKKYTQMDVVLLERIYLKLRPFISNHPNVADLAQSDHMCPKCQSYDVEKRGFIRTRSGQRQRYQCRGCSGWSSEATKKGNGRLVNA